MSNEPLDELYFKWLYSQVADIREKNPELTHWKLLKQLYSKEFVWLVEHDSNRLEAGKSLRSDFIRDHGIENVDQEWIGLGCSVLELVVGLARRLEFQAGDQAHYWFWRLMDNVDLGRYVDAKPRYPKRRVNDILDRVIFRTYKSDGSGGFFPLRYPHDDQTKRELWDQLDDYVLEL